MTEQDQAETPAETAEDQAILAQIHADRAREHHTDAAAAATAEAAAAPAKPDYKAIVNEWINDSIHGSPVAYSVEGYNHLFNVAIPALLARLHSAA